MREMKAAFKMFCFMCILTGLVYPLFITFIAQTTMAKKANGSLVKNNEKIIGAELIAQKFSSEKYFWPRPSFVNYNALSSGGSNLGPTSKKLEEAVKMRKKLYSSKKNIPSELLYASGSGLDPHISIECAYFQIERVAKARSLDSIRLKAFVDSYVKKRQFGFLGTKYVNVLLLNLALDTMS